MMMSVIQNGKSLNVTLGIIKQIKDFSVVLLIGNEDVEIDVNAYTLERVKEMVQVTPFALLPIHMETKNILLDVEVPEMALAEFIRADEEDELQ